MVEAASVSAANIHGHAYRRLQDPRARVFRACVRLSVRVACRSRREERTTNAAAANERVFVRFAINIKQDGDQEPYAAPNTIGRLALLPWPAAAPLRFFPLSLYLLWLLPAPSSHRRLHSAGSCQDSRGFHPLADSFHGDAELLGTPSRRRDGRCFNRELQQRSDGSICRCSMSDTWYKGARYL